MTTWHDLLHAATTICLAIVAATPVAGQGASTAPQPIAPAVPSFAAPEEPPDPAAPPDEPIVEPAAPLTRDVALRLALRANPELMASSWNVRTAEARGLQGEQIPNPEIDIRLYKLAEQDGQQGVERARFIWTQPFELGGKRKRRVELAAAERSVAESEYARTRADVATEAQARFAAVLGAQQRLATLREWVTFVERMEAMVATGVETGALRALEAQRIRRLAALERGELRRAEADLATARFRLCALWGNVTPQFTEAIGSLAPSAELPELDRVLGLAAQGPDASRWAAEQVRADATIEAAKADRAPDIAVGIGARWVETQDRLDWLLDFAISVPIFDRRQGDIREARYERARADALGAAAASSRDAAIAEAYYALNEVENRRVALVDEVIPASRELVDVYRKAFDAGAADYVELFDVRRDLTEAELDYVDTLVEYHEALATLEGLVGLSLGTD